MLFVLFAGMVAAMVLCYVACYVALLELVFFFFLHKFIQSLTMTHDFIDYLNLFSHNR